jgi:hypothetical protein
VLSVFDTLASGGRRLMGRLCVAAATVQALQGVRGCFQVACAFVCRPSRNASLVAPAICGSPVSRKQVPCESATENLLKSNDMCCPCVCAAGGAAVAAWLCQRWLAATACHVDDTAPATGAAPAGCTEGTACQAMRRDS